MNISVYGFCEVSERSVGFPFKNLLLSRLIGGSIWGLRKTQPLAMASKGAGPSYGNPRPMKSFVSYERVHVKPSQIHSVFNAKMMIHSTYPQESLQFWCLQNAMVMHKSRHYGHVKILLFLCRVANGRMNIKVSSYNVQVASLILLTRTIDKHTKCKVVPGLLSITPTCYIWLANLPHVELFAIDKADVLLGNYGVVAFLAAHNKPKERVIWSVSCTCTCEKSIRGIPERIKKYIMHKRTLMIDTIGRKRILLLLKLFVEVHVATYAVAYL